MFDGSTPPSRGSQVRLGPMSNNPLAASERHSRSSGRPFVPPPGSPKRALLIEDPPAALVTLDPEGVADPHEGDPLTGGRALHPAPHRRGAGGVDVLGHHVGDRRVMGAAPTAWWWR